MFGRYIKNKLNIGGDKESPAAERFYTPLRIALHSTVELQTVDMLVAKSALHPAFKIPSGPMEVMAVGKFVMEGTTIHQVYLKDPSNEQFLLQLVEGKNYRSQEPTVDEATLYKQIVEITPETETSLERYLGEMGFMDIEVDGVVYNRLWGDAFTEKADLRTYVEETVTPGGVNRYTNEWLLYGREVENPVGGDPINEFLLIGVEEGDELAQIAMQVGLSLNVSDITVL